MLTGFYILLSKYTGQTDVVLGTPTANRHYDELQDLIGFFVNSSALREQLDTSASAQTLIQQVLPSSNYMEQVLVINLKVETTICWLKIAID